MRSSSYPVESRLRDATRRPGLWLALVAALLAMQISPWWYPTPDALVYLSAARSIAVGHSLTTFGNAQLVFPPGYPFLVSPAFWVSARPFLALSILHWGLAVALMLGVYRWLRRCCPDGALLLTALVMCNVSLWIHYRRTLSELAFMSVLIWTVQSLDGVRQAHAPRAAVGHALRASVLVLLLSMIREVGVLVGVGFAVAAVSDAWRARLRWPTAVVLTALVCLPAMLAVTSFVYYDAAVKAASAAPIGTHLDGLLHPSAALVDRCTEGLRLRLSEVGQLLIPGMFNARGRPGNWLDLNVLVYGAVCIAVATGWWRLVRRREDVLVLTLPIYLLAYILWPFEAGTRYMLPMLPVLWASVWCLIEPLQRHRLSVLAILLLGHLGVATGHWVIKELPRARACHTAWDKVDALASGVRGDSEVVVGARVPACVQYMLAFSLDRLVRVSHNHDADRSARWFVTSEAAPIVPGFSVSLRAAPYTLLVREPER